MPLYELVVVMRSMKRPETAACMKRAGEVLLNNGVVLRVIENLGFQKDIAYRMRAHGKTHLTGSFVAYRFDGRSDMPAFLRNELRRDVDIVKTHCTAIEDEKEIECTLEEELQIPMLRPSVQKLMRTGKKPMKEDPIVKKMKGPF